MNNLTVAQLAEILRKAIACGRADHEIRVYQGEHSIGGLAACAAEFEADDHPEGGFVFVELAEPAEGACIVVRGDIFDGHTFHGPFPSGDAAAASRVFRDADSHAYIVPLQAEGGEL